MDHATVFPAQRMMKSEVDRAAEVRDIGIVVFDGHCLVTTGVIIEAFQLANAALRFASTQSLYRVTVLSRFGGAVTSSSHIAVMTQSLNAYNAHDFHALFVAGDDVRVSSGLDAQLANWLAGSDVAPQPERGSAPGFDVDLPLSHRRNIPIYWVGSRSVASWTVNQKVVQMALSQIAADHGEDMCARIASGLQPPTVRTINSRGDSHGVNMAVDKLQESVHWIRENFDRDISVSDAAAVASMSVRNYLRRFKSEFGVTPLEYLMQLRFEAICAMLRDTKLPVDKIARHCGMGNGDRLGRLFRKRYGVSPTVYRKLSRNQ